MLGFLGLTVVRLNAITGANQLGVAVRAFLSSSLSELEESIIRPSSSFAEFRELSNLPILNVLVLSLSV